MAKFTGCYIPSIDAKDIYLAANLINKNLDGYELKNKEGEWNLRRFANTLDYSLDLIELRKIYRKIYGKNDFSFKYLNHEYTSHVINLTFKYSVKTFNKARHDTFVKLGYDIRDLEFKNCVARNVNGEVVGVVIDSKIDESELDNLSSSLPENFGIQKITKERKRRIKTGEFSKLGKEIIEEKTITDEYYVIAVVKGFRIIKTSAELRHELYDVGFQCNGEHYIRAKRSSGSARVGKCLFINEKLYEPLLRFSSGGISFKYGDKVDLAAYESYIALTSSSIIDLLPLNPENILVIDDYDSVFREDVVATRNVNGRLVTAEENCEISNSIWDGQSLIDKSAMGIYQDKGMVLLRNLMFKSCCFNTNIQKWFEDNGITEVSQLNGRTRATDISQIKLITTPNSIKYLKFSTLDDWLDHLYPQFGVVKFDKKTHYFDGKLVEVHYQLLNTLQLSMDETREFLKDSLEFAQALRDKPEVVRYFIKYPDIDEMQPMMSPMLSKNDVVYNFLAINDKFTETRYYLDFLHDLLASFYRTLKNGHVMVNGNYSTLVGNPVEMLQQSIGVFNGESQLGIGNIHTKRFAYGQTLLGTRSPHVSAGNIWLPYNVENETIDKYFNFTEEILPLNAIGENVLQRLSGADFDSDTVLLTDNQILIAAARRNYDVFKVPSSFVKAQKIQRYYTPEQQADLDIKTSVNAIGEIVNCSQELNSLMWDKLYKGATFEEVRQISYDISQLNVMSGIEIDKAKKEFDVDNIKELNIIRDKYRKELTCPDGRKKMPHFFAHVSRQKGFYNPEKKNYTKYNTTMDYIQTVVNGFRVKHPYKKRYLPLSKMFDYVTDYYISHVNIEQAEEILEKVSMYVKDRQRVYSIFNISGGEKVRRDRMMYEHLVLDINQSYIGYSTFLYIMREIEKPEYNKVRNVLLGILFLCGNQHFNKFVIKSADSIKEIKQGGDDLYYYGIGFKVVLNKIADF